MRALWSRVARPPGTCRCISCASSANIVARSGLPRGLSRARTYQGSTWPTAHTTIFVAGLTIDARVRASRNRQWEQAFEHLQDALNYDRPDGSVTRAPQNACVATSRGELIATPEAVDIVDPNHTAVVAASTSLQEADPPHFGALSTTPSQVEWPANSGPHLVRHNLPPQSLWATDDARLSARRKRYTWKKLAIQEMSVGLLVHDLVRKAELARFVEHVRHSSLQKLSSNLKSITSASEAESAKMRKSLLQSLDRIRGMKVASTVDQILEARANASHLTIPHYYQDVDGDYHEICRQMNHGFEQLFEQLKPETNPRDKAKALAVAKICHNLLVSTASPDLHTFTVLLKGFQQLRMTSLVDSVIACMLASNIRPDETLCRFVLHHYTTQSRPDDFSLFVARMRGVMGGLMLASPNAKVNDASQGRLVQDEARPKKIYQKVYPTPMVFSALIGGVMKFAGFDRALDIYYELKHDNWGLPVYDLTKLLAECVRQVDWEGGTYVWEEILLVAPRANSRDMARAYHTMLSLCSVTRNTVAFNQILAEVVKRGHDRRAILTAAMKTTKWAQYKKSYTGPAFTADNLMIAVSDFVADVRSPDEAGEQLYEEDEDWFNNDVSVQHHVIASGEGATPAAQDPTEAWSAWVEHEFGERPKDPEM